MNKKLLALLLMACMLAVLAVAAGKAAPNATPIPKPKEALTVGVVFAGSIRDGGWNQAHYEGCQDLGKLPIEMLYREKVSDKDDSLLNAVDILVEEGARVIFTTSADYGEYVYQCAENYPEVMFYHCVGLEVADNLSTYMGRMYQARYLTGIVAGMETKTNEIGYIASFRTPEIIRGINAFTLGVRSVNPKAIVHVEWSQTWEDMDKETKVVEQLLRFPIDIMAQHENTANPVLALKKLGRDDIRAIGYNLDTSQVFPDMYITSAVWNWKEFYKSRLCEYLAGQFVSRRYWEGIETGIISISPLENIKTHGVQEQVALARQKLLNGEWDVFYGPIYDSDGKLRVAQGENLPDKELNEIDWFVDGVITK